jgi:hypothetical protein
MNLAGPQLSPVQTDREEIQTIIEKDILPHFETVEPRKNSVGSVATGR